MNSNVNQFLFFFEANRPKDSLVITSCLYLEVVVEQVPMFFTWPYTNNEIFGILGQPISCQEATSPSLSHYSLLCFVM